jgi:UDP-2,3-diacylglucosamine pyrophosphatase LpxH
MRVQVISNLIPVLGILISILLQTSCKKSSDGITGSNYLLVNVPNLELKHGLYYRLKHDERTLELEFNDILDSNSVHDNLSFSDKSGALDANYELHISGRKVLLMFKPGFHLKDGWRYLLTISRGIRSESGMTLGEDLVFEFRTLFYHPYVLTNERSDGNLEDQRNSIACISDIHMGDARANASNYCWFGRNVDALEAYLEFLIAGEQVRQLVILGDLFDEWLIPYSVAPFEGGVTTSREYFLSVANNPINLPIIDKLQEIDLNPDIELVYVHGNHDMLLTEETLREIFPHITWAEDASGLGSYSPVDDIIMEHGHRYDFFNCPQPLVNPNHTLPPGYFVSRLYAEGLMESGLEVLKEMPSYQGSIEFLTAWEFAMLYTLVHLDMEVPDLSSNIILMTGIDGYNDPFSFDGARDMYAANIKDKWDETQTQNEVPVNLGCCLVAIWNGHSDLLLAATEEYLMEPPAPRSYNVVAFGHTHRPLIDVYPPGDNYTGIYGNSGSWVDPEQSSYKVRTYLLITPAEWTGSELDVVSLYQYNLDNENGEAVYKPVFMAEENLQAK